MAILDNDVLLENLQDLEEIPEKVRSPCEGKWEEVLTEALVEISEKNLYDDQKSTELIGTGWEEAVCGWGPVSSTACIHPVKKPKKLKQVEVTDCLLCLGLYSVPDNKDGTSSETKDTIHTDHKVMPGAEHRLVSTIPAEEDLPSEFTDHCSSTAMVSTTETHCDTVNLVSPGEQRQNKDKNAQIISSPFTGGKAIPICKNCYNVNEFPILSSPMLLPPLKATAGIGYAEHMARRKDFLMQQLEKLPSKGSVRGNLNGHILSNTDLKAERRLLEALTELPQEPLKVPEHLSFITSCIPKTPVKDLDRFQWSRSPVEQKLNATNAQPSIKQNINSAPIGFLHTKTMQNKRNVRQEVRPLDARYRRAKSDTTPVLRNTILPSLTVKRVDIPLRIKLC
ncbi:uncharacterized protein C16orf46 homolog isoform X2 [Lithobates pipiens]